METTLMIGLIVMLPLLFMAGYLAGKKTNSGKDAAKQKRLEEYPFYPFLTNEQDRVEFSQPLFN